MADTESAASLSSADESEANENYAPGKPNAFGAFNKEKAPEETGKYQSGTHVPGLHVVDAVADIVTMTVLSVLIAIGFFHLQIQVDGFSIIVMVALFHLLPNILLLVALSRDWDTGIALYMATGIPWLIATLAVFVYMLVQEAEHCQRDTKLDRFHTRCFVPPITLFCLMVLHGILWHFFYQRWTSVKRFKLKKTVQVKVKKALVKSVEIQIGRPIEQASHEALASAPTDAPDTGPQSDPLGLLTEPEMLGDASAMSPDDNAFNDAQGNSGSSQ